VISALNRKLLRDLWQIRGQATAIALVIACGMATFVMSLSTYRSLQMTSTTYFDRYRFADAFAQLQRAPDVLQERIAAIPGVARVQTRIVKDVTLDVPGLSEPATGRLISMPESNHVALNALYLRDGRFPEPFHSSEVLVSEAFMIANRLAPGDRLDAVVNGKQQNLQIVGTVLSPEYLISLSRGEILPDDKRFGVLWMDHDALAAAYDMESSFNDVSLALRREASLPETLQQLDLLLEPYGGFESYGRKDQISWRFLSEEFAQLKVMSVVSPGIFLGVSAFLLNVVLSRIVSRQREQIAMLKAFGYLNTQIIGHYLRLVILIVVAGVLLGIGWGAFLGRGLTNTYAEFYRFPLIYFQLDMRVVLSGTVLCLFFGIAGTSHTVMAAAKLPPAEAMHPEPPGNFRATLLERLGLEAFLSPIGRMILRQLERRPFKSVLSAFGIALAVAVLVLGRFSIDSITYLMEHEFAVAQRQDITVSLVEETQYRAFHELRHLPGVLHAEPFRQVPVRLRYQSRKHELSLTGINPDGELVRILNADAEVVRLPPEGVIISEQLAHTLQIEAGQSLQVEILDGERRKTMLPVAGTVSDFTGMNAWMPISALQSFLREQQCISGAYLSVADDQLDALYEQLKQTPRVAGIAVLKAARTSFRETMAENILKMNLFNIIFACIIAVGVVYNTARISLSERQRELATLRVLGFTRGEVSSILLGELAVVTLAAIPLGFAIGYGFAAMLARALQTDLYRIPLVVEPFTFGFSALVVVVSAIISGLVVRRRVDHFDLISVLKSRD
jgi:putative ABC transport system permease protein